MAFERVSLPPTPTIHFFQCNHLVELQSPYNKECSRIEVEWLRRALGRDLQKKEKKKKGGQKESEEGEFSSM